MSDRDAERSVSRVSEPSASRGSRLWRRVRTVSARTDSARTDSARTGTSGPPAPVDAPLGTGHVGSRQR